jgi:signal transduction histidine kinase
MALGIALVGATFYALVSSHYIGAMVGRTLGPYTDALVEHGMTSSDPEIWQKMAARHGVSIVVEPPGAEPVAFDVRGERVEPSSLEEGQIRAVRTGADGTRVTLRWTLLTFRESHTPLLLGLVVMVILVIGSAFWFLHRQLQPLSALRRGVDSVARGNFDTRVPVVRDDEIGQAAKAFNAMAGRVGEMVDDRERLLGDVSHELRSPIARMKVALEFVAEGDKRDSLARDLSEMEGLIRVLLDREELRSRTAPLEATDVDLEAVTSAAIDARENEAGPGIELVSPGRMPIHADPALLRLLIQNLLDNALKFSRADSGPVIVSLERRDGWVDLRVADDGVGLPPGDEERLFEPFVKGDASRGHGRGYGLGLNLCQRIVELHGGSVKLNRREPRGCEAVVTLEAPSLPTRS